jgi:hypothetical protein
MKWTTYRPLFEAVSMRASRVSIWDFVVLNPVSDAMLELIGSCRGTLTDINQVNKKKVQRWFADSRDIQWDYKNSVR